jgi:hypothetical protein
MEWKVVKICCQTEVTEHTTDALGISSALNPTQPYSDSLAVKSLSIWMFEVENSLYMACKILETK